MATATGVAQILASMDAQQGTTAHLLHTVTSMAALLVPIQAQTRITAQKSTKDTTGMVVVSPNALVDSTQRQALLIARTVQQVTSAQLRRQTRLHVLRELTRTRLASLAARRAQPQ
jgi:hypothetical protein